MRDGVAQVMQQCLVWPLACHQRPPDWGQTTKGHAGRARYCHEDLSVVKCGILHFWYALTLAGATPPVGIVSCSTTLTHTQGHMIHMGKSEAVGNSPGDIMGIA